MCGNTRDERGDRMKSIARYDMGEIRSSADFNEEGFLKCDAIVTRTGVFSYRNPDGTVRRELRHPDEVLLGQSLDTMKMIPVTNDHPAERLVTADNAKSLSVGYTGENIRPDGRYIFSNFVVTDQEAIRQVVQNGKKELSLGYTVDLIEEKGEFEGESYDCRQTNIKYNHLSIVNSARAGSEARIALDESDAVEISQTEEAKMAKRKVKIDQEEFLVEPEAADSIERLLEDMKNLEDEKNRVEEELKMIKDKLEKAVAERDTAKEEAEALLKENGEMKEENEEKMDDAEIDRKVRTRLKLLKQAEAVLDSEDLERVDGTSELEIKKMIIRAKSPNAKLDGKSDVYICARYDAIVEGMPKNQVIARGVKSKQNNQDKADVSAKDARNRMIDGMKNSYKLGGK